MSETIRINGVDVPIDQLEGPDPEVQTDAYRRFHRDQRTQRDIAAGRSIQSSHVQLHGVPRHQKHKGQAFAGVRIK